MPALGSIGRDLVLRLKRFGRNDQVVLSVLALLIGAAAGGAAILFRHAIGLVQLATLGDASERVASIAAQLPWWQILLVPTLGGLVIGLAVRYLMPGQRPHGVADVIEASALHGGRMSLTTGVKAAVLSAGSIGVGASVGREGPVVHLGASLGAWVAKRLHLGRALSRTLLGCGVAAAVAASFNAPIAGTFFALEVVVGHYALSAFAPIVIAAVTGTIVTRMAYGNYPAFIVPDDWAIASFWEFPAFALLGVVSAIAAIAFMRAIFFTADTFARLPVPSWCHPMAGGLLVGLIALVFPEVLGVGYESTDAALSASYPAWLLIALIVAKTAATAISIGSGFSGGVFSPSLFIGAMVGGAFGVVATSAFPELSSGYSAYTLVGMGAVAGAVLGAPISTTLMMFELTNDTTFLIALMIATALASLITQRTVGRSFFTWQLERRDISIKGGQEVALLRNIRIKSLLDETYATIAPDATLMEVRAKLQDAPWGELFVTDSSGKLVGTITFADLHEVAFDTCHDEEWTAVSVARSHPAVLQAHDDLETAVKIYGASGEVHLPVVDRKADMKLIGVAHEHDVVLAYHRAVDQARAEERA